MTTPTTSAPPQVLGTTPSGGFPEDKEISEESIDKIGAIDKEAFQSNDILRRRTDAIARGESVRGKMAFSHPDFGARYDYAIDKWPACRVRADMILPEERVLDVGLHGHLVSTYEKLFDYARKNWWDGRETAIQIILYERSQTMRRAVGKLELREDPKRQAEYAQEKYEAEQARMRASMGNPYVPPQQQPQAPAAQPAAAPARRFCIACGVPNIETARFCSSCGVPQGAPAAAPVVQQVPAQPPPEPVRAAPGDAQLVIAALQEQNKMLFERVMQQSQQPQQPQRPPEDGLALLSRSVDALDSLKRKTGLLSEADVLRERLSSQTAAAANGAAAETPAPQRFEVRDGADGLTRTIIDRETGYVEDKPNYGGIIMTVGGLLKAGMDEIRSIAADERKERLRETERRAALEREREEREERRLARARGELPPAREEPPPRPPPEPDDEGAPTGI